jgi:hypothetical protein
MVAVPRACYTGFGTIDRSLQVAQSFEMRWRMEFHFWYMVCDRYALCVAVKATEYGTVITLI